MRRLAELGAPLGLIAIVAIGGDFVSAARQLEFLDALVAVAMVVALYVFVGNSGVLSFGQTSFVAVGAFADRTYVLSNGELRMTLGPADASDTTRLITAYMAS